MAQQPDGRPAATHGHEIRHGPRGVRERPQPEEQRVAHRPREIQVAGLPAQPGPVAMVQPSGSDQRLQRLLEEVRVAVGPFVERRRELVQRRPTDLEDRREQLLHRLQRERREGVSGEEVEGGEGALEAAQGFLVPSVPGRDRREDADRLALELAGHEMQERERRRVRPVQVLRHDEDGRALGQPLHELGEAPEQPGLRFGGVPVLQRVVRGAQGGEELAQVAGGTPREHGEGGVVIRPEDREERVREEAVRHPGLHGIGAPRRHRPAAVARLLLHRGRDARLPDPRLTGDEDHGLHAAFVAEEAMEALQVGAATDEGKLPRQLGRPGGEGRGHGSSLVMMRRGA